jgi:hypothetical protein
MRARHRRDGLRVDGSGTAGSEFVARLVAERPRLHVAKIISAPLGGPMAYLY